MPTTRTPARAPSAAADWWRIRARSAGEGAPQALAEDEAEILIFGDIGEDLFGEESTSARDLVAALGELPPGVQRLTVRINSFGGSVADGLAIHNALRRHPAEITVSIEGVAVSIASLIAMAGDRIQMAANSLLMIHAPWSIALGNSREMRTTADTLDTYAEAMATSYARASGQDREAILALLTDGDDHWYTADEALAEGFAHEITDALAVQASARFRHRYALPEAVAARSDLPIEETAAMPDPIDPKKTAAGSPASGSEPAMQTHSPSQGEPGYREPEPAAGDSSKRPAPPAEPPAATSTAALRERNEAIRAAFRGFTDREEIRALEADCLADPALTVDQAQAKLLAKLGEGAEPMTPAAHAPRVEAGTSESEKARAGMRDAILARMGAQADDPANEYRGMRLHEMARSSLERSGVQAKGKTPLEIAEAALRPSAAQTTGDFPVILEDAMHKLVISGYDAQPDTWTRFCRQGDVSDFRDHKRLATGVVGNLNEVNEGGEYVNKPLPDANAESIAARRRGAIIQITPEVLVNDDLGEIQRMADGLGRSADRTIESAVYDVLASNPKLSDGKALFSTDHKNLAGTGAAPGVDALDAARVAMMQQKDAAGEEYLDIYPAVAVVPLQHGGTMRTLINAQYDPDASQPNRPNKVAGLVGDVVDSPRVSGSAWYLFADPAVAPVIEVVFLDGQRAPRLTQEENFRTAGLAWRVELPFGVAPVDFRGGYKNPGA